MSDAKAWRDEIERRAQYGVDLQFEPRDFARQIQSQWPNEELQTFFSALVGEGILDELQIKKCPNEACHSVLDDGALEVGECPACLHQFDLEDEEPKDILLYRVVGTTSRDIRWMIVIHGFNTRGTWQEDLSWLVANRLKYSAPILIYKYGWATIDVLSRPLQRRQMRVLGSKIRQAVRYAREQGLPERPDLIAHSFGSHLFTMLLSDPQFKDLRFGRVITVGSIVRPDFDWATMIKTKRIEGVLNQVGGKDIPVLVAQYMIPGTGPSGRIGYLDTMAVNQFEPDFYHSTALEPERLRNQLTDSGIWDRFFTQPAGNFQPEKNLRSTTWKPAWIGFRAVTRLIGWALVIVLGPLSVIRRKLDP